MKDIDEKIWGKLNPIEQQVLELRYGLKYLRIHTFEEIGQLFGCSAERIEEVQNMAEEKIKELMN